jgi:hypothetical protein
MFSFIEKIKFSSALKETKIISVSNEIVITGLELRILVSSPNLSLSRWSCYTW